MSRMSVPAVASAAGPAGTRKAEAFDFIVRYIMQRWTSPSLDEISTGLGVSKSRVRALIVQLEADGLIERPRGTQRAIVVPGLMTQIAIAQLRSVGWLIDDEIKHARAAQLAQTLPHEHLPLVAVIEHVAGHAEPTSASPDRP